MSRATRTTEYNVCVCVSFVLVSAVENKAISFFALLVQIPTLSAAPPHVIYISKISCFISNPSIESVCFCFVFLLLVPIVFVIEGDKHVDATKISL